MSDNTIVASIWFAGILLCDGKCCKAWGINNRPRVDFDPENPDDYAFLADGEIGEAPKDPGTYEGAHGKPEDYNDPERHNKWCARECERANFVLGERGATRLPDFSARLYNMPWLHEED